MWFKAKAKEDPTDKLIAVYEKAKEQQERIGKILDTTKPKKTQAQQIQEALKDYADSLEAISKAPPLSEDVVPFARNGVRGAFYRKFNAATG